VPLQVDASFARSAGGPAGGPVEVDDVGAADVSFPGFVPALAALGASIEMLG